MCPNERATLLAVVRRVATTRSCAVGHIQSLANTASSAQWYPWSSRCDRRSFMPPSPVPRSHLQLPRHTTIQDITPTPTGIGCDRTPGRAVATAAPTRTGTRKGIANRRARSFVATDGSRSCANRADGSKYPMLAFFDNPTPALRTLICAGLMDRCFASSRRTQAARARVTKARSGLGDSFAGLRVKKMEMRGLRFEPPLLAGLGLDMAGLANRHQLLRLAELAV